MRPSAAASAMMRVSRLTERIASSLPGIGYWNSSGSAFVSRMPMTGMPSFVASLIARCSRLASTTQIADGVFGQVADTAERLVQLVELALLEEELLLGEAAVRRVLEVELLELLHAREALGDRLEVGEESTEPALVDVGLADARRLLGEDFLGLLLGADEEDGAAVGDRLLDELVRLVDVRQRLLQVDDVDAAALGEDEALDFRVPPAGLVSEVDAAVEQLANGDDGHGRSPVLALARLLRLSAPDRSAGEPGARAHAHSQRFRSGDRWV